MVLVIFFHSGHKWAKFIENSEGGINLYDLQHFLQAEEAA